MTTFAPPRVAPFAPRRSVAYLAAFGAAGAAGVWLTRHHWPHLVFLGRLWQAQRVASRFYTQCPTVHKNLRFSAGPRPCLDVYRPADGKGYPVFIYVYGGSWASGNKELYAPIGQRLMPEGMVVVIPNYTTYPEAVFPQPTREIAAAIAWTLDNIEHYGGDPRRVVVGGQSAGGQIAGLAVFDLQYLAAHGHRPSDVCGFFGLSGVYDVPAQVEHAQRHGRRGRYVINVMGGRHNLAAASPTNFTGPQAPRTLLIHGDADPTVPLSMSQDLHRRLSAAGAPSELVVYPGGGHSTILFEALAQSPARLVTDITRFVRACTARPEVDQRPPLAPAVSAIAAAP